MKEKGLLIKWAFNSASSAFNASCMLARLCNGKKKGKGRVLVFEILRIKQQKTF